MAAILLFKDANLATVKPSRPLIPQQNSIYCETCFYRSYRYVLPHRVGFLCRFNLKTGIHFAHFCLESVMVFEGTTEFMHAFIVSIPNE